MKSNSQEVLRIMYNQACEDWRHYNSIIWQLPSISIAIGAGVVGAAFGAVRELLPRGLLLLLGGVMVAALTYALVKHRYFHDTRTEFLEQIEKDWMETGLSKMPIQRRTRLPTDLKSDVEHKPKWFQSKPAFAILLFAMAMESFVLLMLAIATFARL